MRTRPLKKYGVVLLAAVLLAAMTGVAFSVTYTLRVGSDNVVMPDNAVVPVWKIADAGTDNVLRFPGPTLVGTVGDNLVITLVNGLPVDNVSTAGPGHSISLVIPGLAIPVVENPVGTPLPQQGPVFDNNTPPRVLSYTQLTPADNGTRTYRFALTKPGTFLYESGADPSVQIGMGIHGAVIVRPAPPNQAQAYVPTATNPDTAFDNEAVLLYSAIDPFLHHAVEDNTYGTAAFPSSIDYEAKYFLLNGKPYQNQADPLLPHHTPIPIGPVGDVTLLRFLNASSIGLAPSFLGTYVTLIGEDGNLLPYPRGHHTLTLPAGKTLDVLLAPAAPARNIPLIDRRVNVTNNGVYPGGFLTLLNMQGADGTGPATAFTSFTPAPTTGISPVLLTAAADDTATGGSNVVAAEWMTDNTVREGSGNRMSGTFGTTVVSDLTAYVPLSAVPADNTLWIRSQDAEGNWSLPVPVVAVRGAASPLVVTETNFVGGQKLIVRATSNAVPAGSDTLTVTGFGPMVYRSGQGIYEGAFWRVDARPATVTVTGTAGSVTAPVPFP